MTAKRNPNVSNNLQHNLHAEKTMTSSRTRSDHIAARSDAAVTACVAEFAEKYDPSGLPPFALESAKTVLCSAAAKLEKLAPVVQLTQERAALDWQIRRLTAEASSLVHQPAGVLLEAFRSPITSLVDTAPVAARGVVLSALLDAYGFDMGPPARETTATRLRERTNQLALAGALQRTIAIEAARLAPRVQYASIEKATAARDRVAGLLDEQAAGAGDTVYSALVALRAEIQHTVPDDAAFARIVTITQKEPTPSVLLAYQLYGSVEREGDIIARNGIRHPGFVSGELKVISPKEQK